MRIRKNLFSFAWVLISEFRTKDEDAHLGLEIGPYGLLVWIGRLGSDQTEMNGPF